MKRYCLSSEYADAREKLVGNWRPADEDNNSSGVNLMLEWYKRWPVCWRQRDSKDKYPVCNYCWEHLFTEEHDKTYMHIWWKEHKDFYFRTMFDELARDVREARTNSDDLPGPFPSQPWQYLPPHPKAAKSKRSCPVELGYSAHKVIEKLSGVASSAAASSRSPLPQSSASSAGAGSSAHHAVLRPSAKWDPAVNRPPTSTHRAPTRIRSPVLPPRPRGLLQPPPRVAPPPHPPRPPCPAHPPPLAHRPDYGSQAYGSQYVRFGEYHDRSRITGTAAPAPSAPGAGSSDHRPPQRPSSGATGRPPPSVKRNPIAVTPPLEFTRRRRSRSQRSS